MSTWQQWTVIGVLSFEFLVSLYKLYNDPTGSAAFSRLIAILICVGLPSVALYTAGFFA